MVTESWTYQEPKPQVVLRGHILHNWKHARAGEWGLASFTALNSKALGRFQGLDLFTLRGSKPSC